jgi:hypothetical protein
VADAPALPLVGEQPADEGRDEESEKKKAHGSEASYFAGLSCCRSCFR